MQVLNVHPSSIDPDIWTLFKFAFLSITFLSRDHTGTQRTHAAPRNQTTVLLILIKACLAFYLSQKQGLDPRIILVCVRDGVNAQNDEAV